LDVAIAAATALRFALNYQKYGLASVKKTGAAISIFALSLGELGIALKDSNVYLCWRYICSPSERRGGGLISQSGQRFSYFAVHSFQAVVLGGIRGQEQ